MTKVHTPPAIRPESPLDSMTEWIPAGRAPRVLEPEELRELMTIRPWRVATSLALQWTLVLAAFAVAFAIPRWWVWVICGVAIGCLQSAFINWTHEASHSNLHRDRAVNDTLADLLIAGPCGVTVAQYRWHHVHHHRYLGDPQKEIELIAWLCLRGGHLFIAVAKHVVGYFALHVANRKRRYSAPESRFPPPPPRSAAAWIGFVAGNAGLFAWCWYAGYWYLYPALWVAPLCSIALLISNFRTIVEHQVSADVCEAPDVRMPSITRIVRAGWLERTLIAPVGFYYHYEHHLFPGVPAHRLPEVRRLLERKGHFDRDGLVVGRGYLRTVWNLAMRPGYGIRLR
jgi:fatty acid desaturase